MPNWVNNWTYTDVTKFLKAKRFVFVRKKGSHEHFRGFVDGQIRLVTVPFHGKNAAINPRTMKSIIAQSGIDYESWMKGQ